MRAKGMKGFFGGVGTLAAGLLGGMDAGVQVLFALMGLDVFSGVLCALLGKGGDKGGFASRRMFLGLTRKMVVLVLVMLAVQLDVMTGQDGLARNAVLVFYCMNEAFSVVENAGRLGVPFPKTLLKTMETLQEKEKREKERQDRREGDAGNDQNKTEGGA